MKQMSYLFCLLITSLFTTLNSTYADQSELVAGSAKFVEAGTGYRFTEGPAVAPGGDIYFSDIPNKHIHKWSHATGKITLAIEDSGGSNGLYFDRQGQLVACQTVLKQVAYLDPKNSKNGNLKPITKSFNGKAYNKPNDLWIDAKGGIYFTDPNYGRQAMTQDGEHVYYLTPEVVRQNTGKAIRLPKPDNSLTKPNGILGTPDGKKIYVAYPVEKKTYVHKIKEDGSLDKGKLFYAAGSDGMTLDEKGNLYLTFGSVLIISPEGKLVAELNCPKKPANICFGGKDGKTLFVTARQSVYTMKMKVKGVDFHNK